MVPEFSPDPDLRILQPAPTGDLIRIGRRLDGGYVVPARAFPLADVLVSLGVENEWSFEAACLASHPRLRVIGVDGSTGYAKRARRVLGTAWRHMMQGEAWPKPPASGRVLQELQTCCRFFRFWLAPRRKYLSRMVRGDAELAGETDWANLRREWAAESKLVVKLDIEGSEYDVLPALLEFDDRILCLIVEFHDLERRWGDLCTLLDELRTRFRLVHTHANNWGGTFGVRGTPRVIELTFLQHSLVHDAEVEAVELPAYPLVGLDYPNNPNVADIPLDFR